MKDGLIVLVAIIVTAVSTWVGTVTTQHQRELERIQIEYRGYRDGVKDSQ